MAYCIYFVVLLITSLMDQTFGFDISLNKNAELNQNLQIQMNIGTIITVITLNRPDGSLAGNCLAPLGGVSAGCATGFTQDLTNGVTTFSIASVSRATDEGTWTSAHGSDTGSIIIKVLTIPTLTVSQTVSALTLSGSNTQSLTITATCAYPAVSLDLYFVPTGGGTAVSSPSSTATCTSTGNAGCADTDAESYDCVIVPKLETSLSAGTYYVQFVVNLAGQYEPIGLNATITDTVITIEAGSTATIVLAVIGLVVAVVCVALCWIMFFQRSGRIPGPCPVFIKSKLSVKQTFIAAVIVTLLCVIGIILCIIALGLAYAGAGFALAVVALVIIMLLLVCCRVNARKNFDDQVQTAGTGSSPISLQGTSTYTGSVGFDPVIQELWTASIAPSTRRSYASGFDKYLQFLLVSRLIASVHIPSLPVSENYLVQFVASCFSSNISYATIKLYICGIRFMCLQNNILYPHAQEMPRLYTILNMVKRLQVRKANPRHPITFRVLERICSYLNKQERDLTMETVCVVAFFGFLRCGEFTVSDRFDPSIHLCVKDLTVAKDSILLTLKRSKTDPFREGVIIKLFRTNHHICPYTICQRYMAQRMRDRPEPTDPLFMNTRGQALSRFTFIAMLKHTLECVGIDSSAYNGHSFRIGAATSAAKVHMEDHLIKTLGRWSSDTYCRYIMTPIDTIRDAQISLVSG